LKFETFTTKSRGFEAAVIARTALSRESGRTHVAAVFATLLVAGLLNENPPHGLGRRGEKVPAMVPVLIGDLAGQPQLGLVNQRGGLKRLAGFLAGHPSGGQFTKLVVDQGQKLAGGVRIAGLDRLEDTGDVSHDP
jgi:hypothetical protein